MPNLFALLFDWLITHLVAIGFAVFILLAVVARGPLFGIEGPVFSPESAQPELSEREDRLSARAKDTGVQATEAPAPLPEPVTQMPESGDDVSSPVSVETDVLPLGAEPHAATGDGGLSGAVEDREANTVMTTTVHQARPLQSPTAGGDDTVFRPTGPDPADHQQFVPLSLVETEAEVVEESPELATSATNGSDPALMPPSRQAEPVDTAALLQQARGEFWNGSLEAAERLYLQYLSLEPTDANSFGELGNLYQSMGRSEDALDAYFEAGVRFKAQGEVEQLNQIVELLFDARDARAGQLRDY